IVPFRRLGVMNMFTDSFLSVYPHYPLLKDNLYLSLFRISDLPTSEDRELLGRPRDFIFAARGSRATNSDLLRQLSRTCGSARADPLLAPFVLELTYLLEARPR